MPRFTVLETSNNGQPAWIVSIPPVMAGTGKRERRVFTDPKEAEKFAAKLRGQFAKGRVGTAVDPMTLKEALVALDLLKPHGIGLLEAVRAYVQGIEDRTDTRSFCDALADYIRRNEWEWSDRYRGEMNRLGDWLPHWFSMRQVCQISPEVIRRAVEEKTTSKSVVKRKSVQIASVLSGKGKERKPVQVDLLTVEQIRKMFRAAAPGAERRALAVLLWAGIRPDADDGEITKLDWSDFRDGVIHVPSSASKTGSARKIVITPRLARLIKGHPSEGTIRPPDWRRRWKAIRRAGGLTGKDETRHCFGTHAIVAFGEGWAISAMGHTRVTTLHRHYMRAVTPVEARSYFGLKSLTTTTPRP